MGIIQNLYVGVVVGNVDAIFWVSRMQYQDMDSYILLILIKKNMNLYQVLIYNHVMLYRD